MRSLPVGLVSLAGLALFLWPFVGSGVPDSTPAWTLLVACVAALVAVELGTRQLDSRALALLAAIAAMDAALRLAVIVGIGGFNPIYFLVLCSGFVFGPSFGFLAGAFSILVSVLAGAGLGPWVPYQAFAMGWVGVGAGFAGLGRHRSPGSLRDVLVLAATGGAMGYLFGALMDVTDWVPVFRGNPTLGWEPGIAPAAALAHFARFYVLTSLAYDTFRAAGNAVMVLALGAPVIAALARFRARLAYQVVRG
jgi:energy-coupling factor transport system substrate-specific component